jgi:hypothetical protein
MANTPTKSTPAPSTVAFDAVTAAKPQGTCQAQRAGPK